MGEPLSKSSWTSGDSDSYRWTVKNPVRQSSSSVPVTFFCSDHAFFLCFSYSWHPWSIHPWIAFFLDLEADEMKRVISLSKGVFPW